MLQFSTGVTHMQSYGMLKIVLQAVKNKLYYSMHSDFSLTSGLSPAKGQGLAADPRGILTITSTRSLIITMTMILDCSFLNTS